MHADSSIFIVVVIVLVVAGFVRTVLQTPARSTKRRQPKRFQRYVAPLDDFPYQLQHNFLTPSELNFFQSLRRVVGNRAVICPKVRLGDVVWVNVVDKSQAIGYNNKTNRKHVDYLLCDPTTMTPLVAVELDDRSHEREDRRERDDFVDGVFEAAGLPLLHVTAKRAYVAEEIAAQLAPYLRATAPVNAAAPRVETKPSASAAPRCPKCDSKMVLRTVQKGENAGKQFWGCPNYPNCRGMVAYHASK